MEKAMSMHSSMPMDDAKMRRFRNLSISLPPDDGRYISIDEVLPAVWGQPPHHMHANAMRSGGDQESLKSAQYWVQQLATWKTEALSGNAVAAQNVGVALLKGELGVPKNESEAIVYFKIAAKAGLAVSMFNLGWAYASGAGTSQSWEVALRYWRKAAKSGHSSAARNLGLQYTLGIAPNENGEPKVNFTEGAKWYTLSAQMGNHKACFALAQQYESGQGVPESKADAAYWKKKGEELQQQTHNTEKQ